MSTHFPHPPPLWTRRLADELWSGAVTPLTYSLLAATMTERMVRRPLRTAGLAPLADLPVFRLHASHVYVNAALLAEVVSLIPGPLRSPGLLAVLPEDARTRLRPRSLVTGVAGTAAIVARLLVREPEWLPWQRAAAFDAAAADVRTRYAAPATLPATIADALGEIRRVQEDLGGYLAVVSWGVVFAYVFYHLLAEVVTRAAPAAAPLVPDLTIGLPGIASLEAHADLVALGARLAAHPTALAAIRRDGAARVWPALAAADPSLAAALATLLVRHGHRLTGRDLSAPTWREEPHRVVGLAALSAAETAAVDAPARRARAIAAVDAACGGGPAGVLARAVIHAVLGPTQQTYALRENMRYHADFFLGRLRALALHAGALLVREGRAARGDDVLFLTIEELEAGSRPSGAMPAADEIAARRAQFARDAARDASGAEGDATTRMLTGITGAPGACRGRVRRIVGADDFDAFEPGEILVASYTDPTWTPILEIAAGLVLEAGGMLSHGAIVARELGIPALVNVTGALGVLRTGETIALDASSGTITRTDAPTDARPLPAGRS